MAPPIQGVRRPARVQRRTASDVAFGLLAILALAVLTLGVPAGLVLTLGLPIPHSLSLSLLTSQLDPMAILKILSLVVWIAWIQLVWCVIVEVRAAVRNVGVPHQVPLAGGTQAVTRRLVTATLLLFSAATALSPAFTHASAAPPRPAHSISAPAQPAGAQVTAVVQPATPAVSHQQASAGEEKIYVVKPPEGRYHESLWEIAQKHLGDGRRYREIFQLNADRIQPDGTKLTIASLIRPGWVLRMPADAHGPGIEVVTQHAQQPDQQPTQQQDQQPPQAPVHGHQGMADGSARSAERPAEPAGTAVLTHQQQDAAVWPRELTAASLLAAGVLAALGRRRRELLWQRAFGRRLAEPTGPAAIAEQALWLGADDPATALLDASLRHLSRMNAAVRKPPPTVFAAHLSAARIELWVTPPDADPPAPWTAASSGGQVWRLSSAEAQALDPGDALAPYPGLVTLGTDVAGRVMVDLEVAQGLIALRGPAPEVQSALAALTVELVTNRWSDRMRVTLVGFGAGLDKISPERVRVTASLDEALPELEQHAASLAGDMARAGLDSVLTGRASGGDPGAWAPHYLLIATPPTPEQAQRLLTLARTRQRTALGFVVAGDIPGATWTWDVTADGQLQAPALGLDLMAQLLPPSQYEAIVSLFAEPGGDQPVTDPAVDAAPEAHLVPGARFAVEIGLLGPVTISAPGPVEPARAALATEVVAYLAAHPGGVHENVLAGAVWPRGVTTEVWESTLARAASWLGTDASGMPNLVTDPPGRLCLGPGVRVDWNVFQALVARANTGQDEAICLDQALSLVRGQVIEGRDPARYTWLTTDSFWYEVPALVADVAHRLSALRLAAGEPAAAMSAARAGLRLAADDETLWRDLLRGGAATGQGNVLRAVVDEISARVAMNGVMSRMAPETEALIDELLPSWRSSVA